MNNQYLPKPPAFKWKWGAFMMPFQFGIGTKAYMTLLIFVPFLNIIWPFVCGAKGEEWAYVAGCFINDDEFKGAMRTWNRSGKVMFIIFIVGIALYLFTLIGAISIFANAFN